MAKVINRNLKIAKGIGYGVLMTVAGSSTIITGAVTGVLSPTIVLLLPIPLIALSAYLTNLGFEGTLLAKKRMLEQFDFSSDEKPPAASTGDADVGSNAARLLAANTLLPDKLQKTELIETPSQLPDTYHLADNITTTTNALDEVYIELGDQQYFEAREEVSSVGVPYI